VAGLEGLKDPEVLALAAEQGRILVSHDETTMPHHFGEFLVNRSSAGVLIVGQQLPHSVVVEELLMIWTASEAEEWLNRICFIPI
jgi:hypothetical protein